MPHDDTRRSIVRRDEHNVPRLNWYRDRRAGWILGVCAGLARVTGIPVEVFRIGFLVATLFGGGILLYIVFAILMPAGPLPPPGPEEPPRELPE